MLLLGFKKGINSMNERKKKKRVSIIIAILFIFLCSYFTFWLLIPGIPKGDDLYFHLSRIVGIKNGLELGIFPVKVYPGYFNGYGYANGLFYPDLFLYIPAILVYLGMKVVTAYKILIVLCTIFSALFMYICVKGISKSRYAGAISMIVYTLASYRAIDVYTRADLGETLAFVFFPLVILGIYKIIYENYKQWYILSFGIAAIFLSHEISSIVVSGFTVLIFLIGLFHMRKEKKRILYFILAGVVACLLTAYFTFPLVQQILSQKFILTTKTITQFTLSQTVEGFLPTIFSFRFNKFLVPAISGVGIAILVIPVLRFKIRKNRAKYFVFSDICLVMGIICLLAVIGWFPWNTITAICKQIGAIQFAWRLLLPATAFLSVSSGIIAFALFKNKKHRIIALIVVLILSMFASTENIYADYTAKVQSHKMISESYQVDYSVGNGEYLPANTNIDKLYSRGDIVTSNDKALEVSFTKEGTKMTIEFYNNNKDNTYIELPLIYYLGYKATIDINGQKVNLPVEKGTNNIIKIPLEGYTNGTISVYYGGTVLEYISLLITIIALILLFIYMISRRKQIRDINKKYNK